jgi:hypothetical protein
MLHYNPRDILSSIMLIFRRSNCIITASGIVTLYKGLYSTPVESGLIPLSTGLLYSRLQRVTIPDVVIIKFDLLKMSMVMLETCRGLKCNIYCYRIKELFVKLVIESSLYYDARS